MAPTKIKAARKAPSKPQKPVQSAFERSESHSDLADRGEVLEKDETEQKLEKLIFGDEAGFLESLRSRHTGKELLRRSSSDEFGEEQGEGDDPEGVADEDVCVAPTPACCQ